MRFIPLALALVVAVAACPRPLNVAPTTNEGEGEATEGEGEGEEGEGDEGEGDAGEGEGDVITDDEAAVDVIEAATIPGQLVDDSLRLLWEVIAEASTQVQQVRTFGTVDLRGGGTGSYSDTPADQLIYLDDGGVDFRFTVVRFVGDFEQPTAREFFLHDHDVAIAVLAPAEQHDFDVVSVLADGDGSRQGSGLSAGEAFEVSSTVDVTTDLGTGTVDYVAVEARSGSVADLEFSDSARYHAFVGDNVVEDLSNDLAVSGSYNGSTWSMTDGRIQRTFNNGAAVEPDFWGGTTGNLRKDNAAFGELGARLGAGTIEIVLVTPGATTVLEAHPQ